MVDQGFGALEFFEHELRYCDDCVWLSFDTQEFPGLVSSTILDKAREWSSSFSLVAGARRNRLYLVADPGLLVRDLVVAVEADDEGEDLDDILMLMVLAKRLAGIVRGRGGITLATRVVEQDELLPGTVVFLFTIKGIDVAALLRLAGRLEDAVRRARSCLEKAGSVIRELEAEVPGAREVLSEEELVSLAGLGECEDEGVLEERARMVLSKKSLSSRGEEGEG